ncbi:MAG: FtsW/RodA/SpoVE family cell cycle protein [Lachnospiraceae bacterium]|nr:FtsW/RodA/SpoVE family cell cycle protein [Lachnospiraceae bacterium]
MNKSEYLDMVVGQMRCSKAREFVREELEEHILDQQEAYIREGMPEEAAMEKAVLDMGDPVETGISMDHLHRPKMSWVTLLMVGIVSMISIVLQWVLAGNGSGTSAITDSVLQQHIGYTVLGYALMLLIYRMDYSILAKYGIWTAAVILALLAADCVFGLSVNGSTMYISIGVFHLSAGLLSWLYIPVFGAVLYHYRGQGAKCFWKILFWAIAPFALIFKGTYLSRAILVYISLCLLMAAAIWKDWFLVPRKRGMLLAGSILLLTPAGIAAAMAIIGNLPPEYYLTKLKNFFSASATGAYHEAYSYTMGMASQILNSCRLIGSGSGSVSMTDLAGYNGEYILVSLASVFGLLSAALVVFLLALLAVKIFQIAFHQKNQLGMILGCGCGIVLMMQILTSVSVDFGLTVAFNTSLPFFSSDGGNLICSYLLLGLVLSIYRYEDILPKCLPDEVKASV